MSAPSPSWLGPAAALGNALTWSIAVLLFKKSGEHLSAPGLNYFKNLAGVLLFGVTLLVAASVPALADLSGRGSALSGRDLAVLLLSGAIGIGVADTLFFWALNRLGAGKTAVVQCIYAPAVVLLSAVLLGEELSVQVALGGGLVLLGVVLANAQKAATASGPTSLSALVVGVLAVFLMALGIVVAKPVLGHLPVLLATALRLLGGLVFLTLLAALHGPTRRDTLAALRPQYGWRYALPGAAIGSYVGLILWIAAFKYASASTASILNQTNALFIVAFGAIFLREPFTAAHGLAAVLAFGGSVLVLM